MAKADPTPDDIMSLAEIKPMLLKSKQEPVSCALALTSDKEGVLLLHKKTKPRALLGALKSEAGKIKLGIENSTLRFGTAEVDTEVDATLVMFRVNKEVPGSFEPRFRERTKKAGFSKVQFVVDELLNAEPETEGQGADAPAGDAASAEADWPALTTTLASLIGGIKAAAGTDAARLGTLSKLAAQASEAVKAKQEFGAATGLVETLRAALTGGGGQAPSQGQAKAGPVAYAKSRLAWIATRKRIETDIGKLQSEIVATYSDQGLGQELAGAYTSWVGPVLQSLDERLADALDDATNATDETKRAELVTHAKSLIAEYTAFLNSDPRITELDNNPFVPLSIRTTVGGTLSTLAKSVY